MTLLSQMKLVELKTFPGRHRTFENSTVSVFANAFNNVIYEDFEINETSLQPLDGRTLQALEEGYRARATYQFWTITPIKGLEENTDQLSDQIQIKGEWYSIYNMKGWEETSFLYHHHCVAIRENVNNSRNASDTDGGNYG